MMFKFIYQIDCFYNSTYCSNNYSSNLENRFQHLKDTSSFVFSIKSPPLILEALVCNHTARDEPLTRFERISCECLLAQKHLEDFVINTGAVESIDGVKFYDLRNKDKSLLHLVLDKCPSWKIMQRILRKSNDSHRITH